MKKIIYSLILLMLTFGLGSCQLDTSYNSRLALAVGVIAIIVVLFLALAFYSNLLREEVSDQDAFAANAQQLQAKKKWKLPNSKAPFSLTKVQFGIWTVIISSAYIYLSLCKGDCASGSINQTALVLMGIFAGTAVASTIIDKNEISDNRVRLQNKPSQGFFIDILSDANGISLHRFQNFAWTVIAMVVYLYKLSEVTSGCELPELSSTLLALTGISSATYLAMKTKENDPPSQAPSAAAAAPAATATVAEQQ
jgi:hypothetical protein